MPRLLTTRSSQRRPLRVWLREAVARGRAIRGQSLVEFALVLPILTLITVMAIDFGRVYFSYIQIHNAAREAANYAASSPTDSLNIRAAALRETDAQAQSGESAIQIPPPVCKDSAGTIISCTLAKENGSGPGNTVTVKVVEDFSFLTPLANGFFNNNFLMSAASTSTVWGYVAAGGTPPVSCSGPVASFVVNVDTSLQISADPSASTPNSGVCNISGYNWTWGDSTTSVGSASGSDHTYAGSGTYTVVLEVTNQGGSSTTSKSVTVPLGSGSGSCPKPVPGFTAISSGSAGKTWTYTDSSTVADPDPSCAITNWLWTFTDLGTQSNAEAPNPQTYGDNSKHPVTLQVTNDGGTSSITLSY